jgi:hypothetical protein
MLTIWGQRKGYKIQPFRAHMEALESIPEGARLRISIDEDRNGRFSSLFHAMLGKVAKAINRGPAKTSVADLKKWVKLKRGWYRVVELPTPGPGGETVAVDYQSTAFDQMGDGEFHRFAGDAVDLIASELAPWITQAPEWEQIDTMLKAISPEGAQ